MIRTPTFTDHNFICDVVRRNARDLSAHTIPMLIDHWIKTNQIHIACPDDDKFFIQSLVIGHKGVLHFAYTRLSHRHRGLAKQLINEFCGSDFCYTLEPSHPTTLTDSRCYDPHRAAL